MSLLNGTASLTAARPSSCCGSGPCQGLAQRAPPAGLQTAPPPETSFDNLRYPASHQVAAADAGCSLATPCIAGCSICLALALTQQLATHEPARWSASCIRARRLRAQRSPQHASAGYVGSARPSTRGRLPRSTLPEVVKECRRFQAAGHDDIAWLFERLHADALLPPLAQVVSDDAQWQALRGALQLTKPEAERASKEEEIADGMAAWIVTRFLSRGRFCRFARIAAGEDWQTPRDSISRAYPPRRPTLPSEWTRPNRARTPEVQAC